MIESKTRYFEWHSVDTGNIRLIKGFNNNKNFSEFTRIMDIELTKKGYPYVFISSLILAKINYTDFLNE